MNRSERRHRTEVKQKSRIKNWQNNRWEPSEKLKGKLKHTHYGCGCTICKPWKHGYEDKHKPSELRKLYNGKDDL